MNLSEAPPYEQFGETMSSRDNILLIPSKDGATAAAARGGVISPVAPQKLMLGPRSQNVVCPYCSATIRTRVNYTTTTRTHIAAVLCGFICCCCCLPYCMDSARNTDHYCPNQACGRYLGTYEK